jgi:hypothetical protein
MRIPTKRDLLQAEAGRVWVENSSPNAHPESYSVECGRAGLLRVCGGCAAGRCPAARRSAGLGGGSRHVVVMRHVVHVMVHDMVNMMVRHVMVRRRSRLLRRRFAGRRGRRRRRRLLGDGVSGKADGQNRGGQNTLDHGWSFLLERDPLFAIDRLNFR